jgi:hypothetical protein
MAVHGRRQQQKLERKKAKSREERKVEARLRSGGISAGVASFPILHACAPRSLDTGLAPVLLSRRLPEHLVACSLFLVDLYCLGVKNVMSGIVPQSKYLTKFNPWKSEYDWVDVDPSYVRKLVEESVNYARRCGFSPHAEYQKAEWIFGDIDAGACATEFEFGQGGKPFYVQGPSESPERSAQILSTLMRTCGKDNFHFVVANLSPDEVGRSFRDSA